MTQPPDPNAGSPQWQQQPSPEGYSPHVSDGSTQNLPTAVPTPPPTGFSSPEEQSSPVATQSPIDPFATPTEGADDDADQKKGRDRLFFTFIWEGCLLAAVIGLVLWLQLGTDVTIASGSGGGFSVTELIDNIGPAIMVLALLGLAFGLTVRMGAPNFGVLIAPVLGSFWIANFGIEDATQHLSVVIVMAAIPTAVMVVMSVYLRLSPWLSGFVAALAVYAFTLTYGRGQNASDDGLSPEDEGFEPVTYDPHLDLDTWQIFAIVVVLCVGSGLLGLLPAMRDRFSKVSAMLKGDEPRSGSLVTFLAAGTFLAGLLGIGAVHGLELLGLRDLMGEPFWSNVLFYEFISLGGVLTFVALALVVIGLGGTSLKGRRGGIAGVLLASAVVYLVSLVWASEFSGADASEEAPWMAAEQDQWIPVVAIVLVVLALVVSVVADNLGHPKDVDDSGGEPEVTPFGPNNGSEGDSAADLGLFGGNQDENANMFPPSSHPHNQ